MMNIASAATHVQDYSVHKIDIKNNVATKLSMAGNAGDLSLYISNVIAELESSSRSRGFKFINDCELVPLSATSMFDDPKNWDSCSQSIAEKLLSSEIDAQNKIDQLGKEIRKGCLLQVKLQDKILLIKIDDDDFFDEADLKIKSGLPTAKTRYQKSAIISFDVSSGVNNGISSLLVSDSKPKITEYWYKYFLTARELVSSEVNTQNAFSAVDIFLKKEVKPISSVDFWHLRNDVVSYFRNSSDFVYDELVIKLSDYKPESEELKSKLSDIVDKFRVLPTAKRKPFETQFDIAPDEIKARIKKTIILDENIELKINGDVRDFDTRIISGSDDKGKYIKIYSDKGYDEFAC